MKHRLHQTELVNLLAHMPIKEGGDVLRSFLIVRKSECVQCAHYVCVYVAAQFFCFAGCHSGNRLRYNFRSAFGADQALVQLRQRGESGVRYVPVGELRQP